MVSLEGLQPRLTSIDGGNTHSILSLAVDLEAYGRCSSNIIVALTGALDG